MTSPRLPIDEALPQLLNSLRDSTTAVLVAPPGAGKTTGVPLALLREEWLGSKTILMLEPRRVAARAAAERMASMLGETVGQTVGYRVRRESAVSDATRIEVVTEGILTRRLQSDPALDRVGVVLFDEFHERSIHADLGLALMLDVQSALREDMRLVAMSATLDDSSVAALMNDAPIIRSEGKAFPVETRWLDVPWRKPQQRHDAFEKAVAELTLRAMDEETGDALVFLPGVREIERVRALLPDTFDVRVIHGSLPFAKQRAALAPATTKRRIVLASAIAETSLTIEGVRIVVDGGLSRRALFDPGAGMTRLVTRRVAKASAEQRRGRAGRTESGVCYRLWTKGEEGGFALRDPAEILEADLASLVLELSAWGVSDPSTLRWLDTPPLTAVEQARDLLRAVGAIDAEGRISDHGRVLAAMPVHPRLGHLVMKGREQSAGRLACDLAAVLEERDPLSGAGVDLRLRLEAVQNPSKFRAERIGQINEAALARIRESAKSLSRKGDGAGEIEHLGQLVALAYPDRIAQRRRGGDPRYVTLSGKGAVFANADDPLAGEPFLAIAHLDGNPREARIRLAAPISRSQIDAMFGELIQSVNLCEWDEREKLVRARQQVRLGALVLDDKPSRNPDADSVSKAAADGIRSLGLEVLPWEGSARRLRERVGWARHYASQSDFPDWSDAALMVSIGDWLEPHLADIRMKADFEKLDLHGILLAQLDWTMRKELDRLAPSHLDTPAGSRAPIDYASDPPALEVRIQEMFGETRHPSICDGKVPLLIRFLSPARRPVQVTGDLPGFWKNSYADVRKDLRGRYPRHPWPEDPSVAEATSRANKRKR